LLTDVPFLVVCLKREEARGEERDADREEGGVRKTWRGERERWGRQGGRGLRKMGGERER
jgi:hypothetical protein